MKSARDEIHEVVEERACRDTLDKLASLRSDGNAERTVRDEYHGRFLIELLQNARDAWMKLDSDAVRGGRLRIELSEGSLVVANEGIPVSSKVLLYSLGKFGESTKPRGEGIGHKGIGFKSVLEVTLTPELYSRAATPGPFDLAVRFDPQWAADLVESRSADLAALEAELPAEIAGDLVAAVPVLAFPQWVDEPDRGWEGFNTVVRLVHDDRFDEVLELDAEEWQRRAVAAVDALTDQIVLLLAVFERIEIDVAGESLRVIERRVLADLGHGPGVSEVEIRRNGAVSTRWRLFERSLPGYEGLEGDLAVGVRLVEGDTGLVPVLPSLDEGRARDGDCFHLFFPTVIATHLPFLLHAYFEVNASRTGFAAGAVGRNRALLDGLEDLAIDSVARLVADPDLDRRVLPSLFAATASVGDGEAEALAPAFRERLLARLDEQAWVAAVAADGTATVAAPVRLLVDHRDPVAALLPVAFPSPYLVERVDRFHPDPAIDPVGLAFLAARSNRSGAGAGVPPALLDQLLCPGDAPIWAPDQAASGFVACCRLLAYLLAADADSGEELVKGLRGRPDARIIPAVTGDGEDWGYVAPPPATDTDIDDEAEDGVLGGAIFARVRVRARAGAELAPPGDLGVAFVPDGVLDSDLLSSVGARLGIREYTTNAVLDRLAAAGTSGDDESMLRFIWRLLLRERDSRYGIRQVLYEAAEPEPGQWFWCEPGRARNPEGRTEQRRAHALAHLHLPTADETWRPATELAFGPAWADPEGPADAARRDWYRDLGAAAPGTGALVAAPEVLAELLPLVPADAGWLLDDEAPPLGDEPVDADRLGDPMVHRALLHALLLRLGVWEVPPLEAVVSYRGRSRADLDPWSTLPGRDEHLAAIAEDDGLRFGVKYPHDPANVHVSEDYRLRWPLEAGDESARLRALGVGATLYRRYGRMRRFCPRCKGNHDRRYHDDDRPAPSALAWQLAQTSWVPVVEHGEPAGTRRPADTWSHPDPPTGTAALQSPYRYLPLAAPQVPMPLQRLADIPTLEAATPDRLLALADRLRGLFELDAHPGPMSGPTERQTFIRLHRRLYGRLAAAGEDLTPAAVLAEDGTRLTYVAPGEARFDDGRHAGYRRHFQGEVAFAALAKDQESVAARFGIPKFRLQITRRAVGEARDVTDQVRPLLHDRLEEIMAVLVFHAVSGPTLELGSDAFRERARRLARLRVHQVDDLVLDLRLEGTDLVVPVGVGTDRDLYVEGVNSASPLLYHDLNGTDWLDRLRRHVAPHLAELVENPAYAATLEVLLGHDDPDEREAWLLGVGVTDNELEQVRDSLAIAGLVSQEEERRWWQALLPLLGANADLPAEPDALGAAVRVALDADGLAGGGSLGQKLLEAGGGPAVRRDARPDGTLAALEAHGVTLAELDEGLRALGDQGLRVDRAARQLRDWVARHGHLVAAVLHLTEHIGHREDAVARPATWSVPPAVQLRVAVDAADVLDAIIDDLTAALDAPVDRDRLAGTGAADYLAGLVSLTVEQLDNAADALYHDDDRQRLDQQAALAWRGALIPRLTALVAKPNEPAYRIRAVAESVAAALPHTPSRPEDLLAGVAELAAPHDALVEALTLRLQGRLFHTLPAADGLDELFTAYLDDEGHLQKVLDVLRRGPQQRIDTISSRANQITERGLIPRPYEGSAAVPVKEKQRPDQRNVERRHVKRDPRRLKQIGDEGESWALAAVMAPLLAMDLVERRTTIDQLTEALTGAYRGDCIDELAGRGAQACSPAVDDDERTEALADFLHLARTSDMFGSDLLGWLPALPGEEPRPLFLEVKSTKGRSALISTHEWDEAARLGDAYAVLLVIRDKTGEPDAIELLPNPVALLDAGLLTLTPDGYELAYAKPDEE